MEQIFPHSPQKEAADSHSDFGLLDSGTEALISVVLSPLVVVFCYSSSSKPVQDI